MKRRKDAGLRPFPTKEPEPIVKSLESDVEGSAMGWALAAAAMVSKLRVASVDAVGAFAGTIRRCCDEAHEVEEEH